MLVMPVDNALTGLAPPLTFNDTLSHAYVALNANSALAVYLEAQALKASWRLRVRVRAQRTLRFCAPSFNGLPGSSRALLDCLSLPLTGKA
ncbi:hypothetical protein D3C80_1131360 [compost metagenome]